MSTATLIRPVGATDHTAGSCDASITLVEYCDFECPYCRMAEPIVHAVRNSLGDRLRFVYRHFPLAEIHPHARLAAQAAEAAAAQGRFWEMKTMLFANQRALALENLIGYAGSLGLDTERFAFELRTQMYARRVSDDFRDGVRSGVNGTPTFFVNNERYDAPWTEPEGFIRALRELAGG